MQKSFTLLLIWGKTASNRSSDRELFWKKKCLLKSGRNPWKFLWRRFLHRYFSRISLCFLAICRVFLFFLFSISQNKYIRRLQACRLTLSKKRLWHRCFTMNFAKFLTTTFSQNTSGGCFHSISILLITCLSWTDSTSVSTYALCELYLQWRSCFPKTIYFANKVITP